MKLPLKIRRWIQKVVRQRWRNEAKLKKQTYRYQKRHGHPRPVNKTAYPTALFKYRFGIN